LRQFKHLKEIILKDNNIHSLLQLAKFEMISSLRSVVIENNAICNCSFLREFIVYRFPFITSLNQKEVKEADRARAKQMFHNFDRILQIPEKHHNPDTIRSYSCESAIKDIKRDKHYMKVYTKAANEVSEKAARQCVNAIKE